MGKKWENLCNKCALCCHEKIIIGSTVYTDLDTWCKFLDENTGQCTIYDKRFKKNKRCTRMTLFKACMASWLPSSCGYVQWAQKHKIRFASKKNIVYFHSNNPQNTEQKTAGVLLKKS